MSRIARRPSNAVDVYTGGDDIAALEAALAARKVARDKGLPDPIRTTLVGDRVEVSLLWPHLLLWIGMLDGLGQADQTPGYENGPHRMQVVPDHRSGDYSVHGWTEVDNTGGGVRYQQWVLHPVHEPDCTRCADLPEPRRQPLSIDAWFHQQWYDLTGRNWEQPNPALAGVR